MIPSEREAPDEKALDGLSTEASSEILESSRVVVWNQEATGNKLTFPAVSDKPATKRDYVQMMLFVFCHVLVVIVPIVVFWVPKRQSNWVSRLLFAIIVGIGTLIQVGVSSWWFKSASLTLGLIFTGTDFVMLSLVALFVSVIQPYIDMSSIPGILIYATITETIKLLGYGIPLSFKLISCGSHLLFTAGTVGALNFLYSTLFSGFKREDIPLWESVVSVILHIFLYSLWPLIGASILLGIKRGNLRVSYFAPLVLVIPIIFHAGYLLAVQNQSYNWLWAIITVAFWVATGIALKILLSKTGTTGRRIFVSSASCLNLV
jgi:hypothetical protein